MTQAEIFAGNKQIADFMGYVKEAEKAKDPYLYAVKHAYENGNMNYHKSWDWLMPVVLKLRILILDPKAAVPYDLRYTTMRLKQGLLSVSIEKVYEYCLVFIKWYNEHQPG